MDMYELLGKDSPEQIGLNLAKRFKACRKNKHITQKELADKSLISYGTIKLFEQKGQISLSSLLVIAETLDMVEDFNMLFIPEKHRSYKDLINEFERNK